MEAALGTMLLNAAWMVLRTAPDLSTFADDVLLLGASGEVVDSLPLPAASAGKQAIKRRHGSQPDLLVRLPGLDREVEEAVQQLGLLPSLELLVRSLFTDLSDSLDQLRLGSHLQVLSFRVRVVSRSLCELVPSASAPPNMVNLP